MIPSEAPPAALADLRRLLSRAADRAAAAGTPTAAADVLDALAHNGDATSAAVVEHLAMLGDVGEPARRSALRRLRPPRTTDAVRHSAERALRSGARGEDPVASFLRELGRTGEGTEALRETGVDPQAWDRLLDARHDEKGR